MRVGFFGGAFDPPHLGHVNTARQAVELLQLDKLIVMPTAVSPHKRNSDISPQIRLEMSHLAFSDIPGCVVSDMEISRGGVSYTADTIELVAAENPKAELFLIMGNDMFMSFHSWRMPEKIAKFATLAVFKRGSIDDDKLKAQEKYLAETIGAKVVFVDNEIIEISSTEIRSGEDMQLLPSVKSYVDANNLYLIQRIENYVNSNISDRRARHIFGTRDTAVHLAERYGADTRKAEIAALLHDATKEWDNNSHKQYAQKHGEMLHDAHPKDYKLFHAVTGSIFAREHFKIGDDEILDAIRYHTTGKANMSMLEKIIFIADVIEPTRTFPEVKMLSKLASDDINAACKWYCEFELARLLANGAVPADDMLAANSYFAARSDKGESFE